MLLRRMLIMLAAVIAVVAILAGYKVYSIRQQIALFSAPKPPISVTASLAEKRPWQSRLPAIGSLKAFQGVTLTAEVSGTVRDVLFLSGDQVKLDQPLIQLESDVDTAISHDLPLRLSVEKKTSPPGFTSCAQALTTD